MPLNPFYLTPLALAVLTWWVATRRHPEDKEKWSMFALGISMGAVLMFALVFFSQRTGNFDSDTVEKISVLAPSVRLEGDRTVEILPPMRIQQNRSVGVGPLQITLDEATQWTATLSFDSPDGIEFFEKGKAPTRFLMQSLKVPVGGHVTFGLNGHLYQLGLLEIQRPLWGMAPEDPRVFHSSAVIRILDRGAFSGSTGGPPPEGNNNTPPDPEAGLGAVPAPAH